MNRNTLHNEIHARPSMYFEAPAQVFHLAFLDDGGATSDIIQDLCDRHVALADPALAHGEVPIGDAQLQWERHTEFLTLTLVQPGPADALWPPLPPVLADIAQIHGKQIIQYEDQGLSYRSKQPSRIREV